MPTPPNRKRPVGMLRFLGNLVSLNKAGHETPYESEGLRGGWVDLSLGGLNV